MNEGSKLFFIVKNALELNGMKELLDGAVNYVNATPNGSGGEIFNSKSWKTDMSEFTLNTAAFRSVEGHDHTMFVFDMDVYPEDNARIMLKQSALRNLKLRAVLFTMQTILDKDDNFFCYLSGKGGYMVRRLYPNVYKANLYRKVWEVVDRCNEKHDTKEYCEKWHHYKKGISRWVTIDNYKLEVVIDRNMIMKAGAQVFRVPYSPYTKVVPNIYICAPVLFQRNEKNIIDVEASLKNTELEYCKLVDFEIPYETIDVEKTGDLIIDANAIIRGNRTDYTRDYVTINIPLPNDDLNIHEKNKILTIKEKLTGEEKTTPPCIKRAYTENTPQHWNRVIIGRYLLHKGFTLEDIALFIRFNMNDDEDNSLDNLNELERNINVFIAPSSDNPRKPPGCQILRDKASNFYVATSSDCLRCGRQYVLQEYANTPSHKLKEAAEKEGRLDESLSNKLGQNVGKYEGVIDRAKILLDEKLPTVIKKTTRAGLTTSLVVAAKKKGKRLLVLEPTNKIASRTFPQAVEIAKQIYNTDIRGAVLSSNPRGCLKIALQVQDLHRKKNENPDWGDVGVQFHKLPLVLKPSCNSKESKCEYFDSEFDINNGDVVINSDVNTLQCARISVLKNLEHYDALFVTYSKLLATAKNESDQNVVTMYELADFDVVLLDEISSIIEGQPSIIPIAGVKNGKYYLKTDNIRKQLVRIAYDNSPASHIIIDNVERSLQELEKGVHTIKTTIKGGKSTLIITNPLSDTQREVNLNYYDIIQNAVARTNIDLSLLAEFYLALSEEEWYLTVITNMQNYTAVNMITKPELNIIKGFLKKMIKAGKSIMVTDASLPPSSLQFMNRLLDIKKWNVFDMGDPQHTNDQCLIIPDSRRVSISQLERQKKLQYDALNFAQKVIKQHGQNDVMLVFPNKKDFYRLATSKLKYKYPGLKMTYYRSDSTVGVASKRRVMVAYCQPIPPADSFNWLATHFAREDDIDMTSISNLLRGHSAKQAFYQTIGRVKDPASVEFSVVYMYGIRYQDVESLLFEFYSPRILKKTDKNYDLRILTGFYWRTSGIRIPPAVLKTVEYINKRQKATTRSIQALMKGDDFKFLMKNLSAFGLTYIEKSKRLVSSTYET